MPTRRLKSLLGVLALGLGLGLAPYSAQAHNTTDASAVTPQASSVLEPAQALTGTVKEVVVDNRVARLTTRYFALRLDDGRNFTLSGPGVDRLVDGARIEATGQIAGETLSLNSYHVIAGAAIKAKAASAADAGQVQGTLGLVHADNFDQGQSAYSIVVRDSQERVTPLRLAVTPDVLEIGMSVIAQGTVAADGVSLDVSSVTVLAPPPPQPSDISAAPLTNTVLVILVQFPGAGAPAFTPAQVDQVMRTNSTSVANYYQEASYGQQLLNVTVTPWLMSASAAPLSCDYTAIGNAGDAAATAAGYAPGNYQNRFYVFPSRGDCGWAGLAYISFGLAWSNGYNQLSVYAHELGHNFGLLHAASSYCPGQVVGSACSVSDYGDPFDVMGNSGAMHFNAKQKSILNWIPAASVKTHSTGSAIYTLSPLESPGGATYAVKIPAAASRTYWLEYRQPIGFDSGMSSYPNNGAQVRVASPFESLCSGCMEDTQFLDMTPGTANNFGDGALIVGQTYVDSSYGTTISVLSATPSALTVQVTAPGGTPTTTTAVSSLNPSTVGASVTFTATVTGNAPTGSVNFKDGTTSIAGCATSAVTGAGNSRTATCSTTGLTLGTHSIVGSYSGDVGNSASSSSILSQVIASASGYNVALASAGGVASASSTYSPSASFPASSINNNERAGANWGNGGGWIDGTPNAFPDWVQIVFNGQKTIDHVVVYSVQDNFTAPVEPTNTQTFSLFGVTNFTVDGWNGSAWTTLATVAGNTLVKRTVTFSAFTTDRIRITITSGLNSYSRLTEVEAWGVDAGPPGTNVASAGAGAIASASSTYNPSASFPASSINNNERAGANWGNGGGWIDGTANAFPDWVQIAFSGPKTINRVVVYSVQDNFTNPVEPTDTQTFSTFGVTDFTVDGWNGSAWVTLATVSGNNLVKRSVAFLGFTTDRIRISITNGLLSYSRLTEVEAWGN